MDPSAPGAVRERELRLVMSPNPVIVDRGTSVTEALARLESYGFRHLPVVEVNRVLGIVSERDLRVAAAALPAATGFSPAPVARRVGDVMRHPVHCLQEDSTVADAVACMLRNDVGSVPVLQDHALVGIVTETDVLRWYVELGGEAGSDAPAREHAVAIPTVPPHATVGDALARLDPRSRHVGVVDGGALVGMVSERELDTALARDVARAARTRGIPDGPLAPTCVRDVMASPLVAAEPDTPLWRCAGRMLDQRLAALPVVAGRTPVGIVTSREILAHFAARAAEEAEP